MITPSFQKWLFAILLFAVTIASRWQLVDRQYHYSFESDSESCVNITRSFYFFFKNPQFTNAPQTLSSYPTYMDGSDICAAITANLVRPLVKYGIIKVDLSDSDDSIIIFSMRWNSVLFDALATAIVFLIISLITSNNLLSVIVVFMCYILNTQTLDVDLIRVDHYSLFVSCSVFYIAVRIFKQPDNIWNFILAGLLSAMTIATKLNFPFYILILLLILLWLLFNRKLRVRFLTLMFAAFIIGIALLFQRWFLYPENVIDTLKEIIAVGKEWSFFWGIKPYLYYHWQQFFEHGFNWGIFGLVLAWYISVVGCAYTSYKRSNHLLMILCFTFLVQSGLYMLVPKVGRYGMIIPLWVGLFFAIFIQYLFEKRVGSQILCVLAAVFLLPNFVNSISYLRSKIHDSLAMEQSILDTRLAAANWLMKNALHNSKILLYHPRLSNPPIFERPYQIDEIEYPFLSKEDFVKFSPPQIKELENNYNYFVVADKEKIFHLNALKAAENETGFNFPEKTSGRWELFYDSLDNQNKNITFASGAENYGVRGYDIYSLSKDSLHRVPIVKNIEAKMLSGNEVELSWEVLGIDNSVQIQISTDSSFKWILHGSIDGFKSKYRRFSDENEASFIPPQILNAVHSGEFEQLTRINKEHLDEVNLFFRNAMITMQTDSIDFKESIMRLIPGKEDRSVIFKAFQTIFPKEIFHSNFEQYLLITGLSAKLLEPAFSQNKIRVHLNTDENIYWRVRLKNQEWVSSEWSEVAKFQFRKQ